MTRYRFFAAVLALCLFLLSSAMAQNCRVSYSITNSWTGGFQAAITITNTGPSSISAWTLQWTFSGNQQITNGWNGSFGQNRQTVTVTSLSYNGTIASGSNVSGIGFTANSTGTNTLPSSFTLNGSTCQGGTGVPPPGPTGLTAQALSVSSSSLSWTASALLGVTYNVYRSTVANFAPSASTRIAIGITATTFVDGALAPSTIYFYLVTAVAGASESTASNQATVSTQLNITAIHPASGVPGSLLTITGSAFGTAQGSSTVTFGSTPATVTAWSSGSITVTVPTLGLGNVGVTVTVNGSSSNSISFSVTNTPPSTFTGFATHFDALGSPFGGCGLPQSALDSQNFVALNVQNTPGDYTTFLARPIGPQFASEIGLFNNGLNCGRWVQVAIGDFCTGTNDGAPGKGFCYGSGGLVADSFNGATLNMVVADSCQDGNGWCRDNPDHLDLATASINQFLLNGQSVGDLLPNHWNNRQISWQFISAPNYSGDIVIGFIQGANVFWPAIGIAHLPNGIHGVDSFTNGAWQPAKMDSDLGQDYIIAPTASNGSSYQIRVHDASDQLINSGRVYSFSFPANCGQQCGPAFTAISYTTQ